MPGPTTLHRALVSPKSVGTASIPHTSGRENNPGGNPAPEHREVPVSVEGLILAQLLMKEEASAPSFSPFTILRKTEAQLLMKDEARAPSVRGGTDIVVYYVERNRGPAPDERCRECAHVVRGGSGVVVDNRC